MSQLRMGRKPDGTRAIVLQEPARARPVGYGNVSAGFFSGTVVEVGGRGNGDDTVRRTSDNQGVEPTEYRRFRP